MEIFVSICSEIILTCLMSGQNYSFVWRQLELSTHISYRANRAFFENSFQIHQLLYPRGHKSSIFFGVLENFYVSRTQDTVCCQSVKFTVHFQFETILLCGLFSKFLSKIILFVHLLSMGNFFLIMGNMYMHLLKRPKKLSLIMLLLTCILQVPNGITIEGRSSQGKVRKPVPY